MIIRNAAIRHSRRALAIPANRSCLRALSTDGTTTSVAPSSSQAQSEPPSYEARPAAQPQAARRWGAAPEPVAPKAFREKFIASGKLYKKQASLGSSVENRYSPGAILANPPAPKDVTLELLMASQTHMGHNTSLWNPANSRYIYGIRSGIHIISLEQTAAHLRRAARVVEEVAFHGGLILFVGTRKGQMEVVVKAAEMAGACHLFQKWTPGTITNRDRILGKHGMKVVDAKDKELEGFDRHLMERRQLVPDLVVVLNPLENFVLLHECMVSNIPTIGVIDTDADPTRVTYTIPANDDSMRSISVIAGVLGRAGQMGQKRRLREAQDGNVTWTSPADVAKFIDWESARLAKEAAVEEQQGDAMRK